MRSTFEDQTMAMQIAEYLQWRKAGNEFDNAAMNGAAFYGHP